MPLAREQRKLAAIVAADVVGYSRLMGRDESGTLAHLRRNRSERLDPVLAKYGGRLVKLTGDGALVEFASAVDALSAAIEFQQAMAEVNADQPADAALVFRMGLHLGDLIVEGDDLYGDGVNVAARLEGQAPEGGILISRNVRDAVAGRVKATFEDLGGLSLKNIERPVRAFRVHWEASNWQLQTTPEVTVAPTTAPQAPLPLPNKPSIAVLPFQNMSGDPEQEYFADGIVDDIITELSRFRSLFVIARNSSFTYKGKAVDVRAVARDLGVRYVLEGGIRKATNRVRVTAQLIDASTGHHLWAERYDRDLEDIFAVQEELTTRIVGAIAPEIKISEELSAARRTPENLTAYEIALRAHAHLFEAYERTDRAMYQRAIAEGEEALRIDPNSALALWSVAYAKAVAAFTGIADNPQVFFREAEAAANRLVELDVASASGYAMRAMCVSLTREHDRYPDALADARRAHELNPNDTIALYVLGQVENWLGDADAARDHAHQVLRLSPLDRRIHLTYVLLANACFVGRRYEEGANWALRAQMDAGQLFLAHLNAITCFVGMGEIGRAKAEFAKARSLAPAWLEALVQGLSPYARKIDRDRQTTFLRIAAGLEDPSAAEALR
jgi:adenylate cyclase